MSNADHSVLHDSRVQITPYQLQETFVLNLPRHPADQHIVIDLVEKFLQVQVHDPTMALRDVFTCLPNGLQRATSRTESIAVVGKTRVEQPAHYLL